MLRLACTNVEPSTEVCDGSALAWGLLLERALRELGLVQRLALET